MPTEGPKWENNEKRKDDMIRSLDKNASTESLYVGMGRTQFVRIP